MVGQELTGKISRLFSDKGFGFISAAGERYFFHRSGCKTTRFDALREGDTVRFRVGEPTEKGPRAETVWIGD